MSRYVAHVKTVQDLSVLRARSDKAARQAVRALSRCIEMPNPMDELKFEPIGSDPCAPDRAMNLLEQINLQATYEVAYDATDELLVRHPGKEWILAPGSHGIGPDIQSTDGEVVCEVFAAVDADNNGKREKDLKRIAGYKQAKYRYLFYRDAKGQAFETPPGLGIQIISLARKKISEAS